MITVETKIKLALHVLIAFIAFLSLNIFAFIQLKENPYLAFAVLMSGYLSLGFLHYKTLYKAHSWAKVSRFVRETGFTITLTLIAFFTLEFTEHYLQGSTNTIPFALTTIYFMLPFLIKKTLHEADYIATLTSSK